MRVLTQSRKLLKLDANDWKILFEIKNNIRQPLTKIAKKCYLSRQSVEYRLKQMAEKELIIGSRTLVNIRKLGYQSYHAFIEVHTADEEKKLLSRARKADFVNAVVVYSGKYNLEISITAKDEKEFLKYYTKLVEDIRIRDDQTLILLDTIVARVLPERYFPIKKKKQERFEKAKLNNRKSGKKEIDAIDVKLLYNLSMDATKTNLSLAKELGLSKDATKYRTKQLEMNKFILEYRPVVNFSALGLSINTVLVKLNFKDRNIQPFENFLKSEGSVLWCTKTFGYYDYLIYIVNRNLDEFHQTVNGIKQKFGEIIQTYETLFAYEELKYEFMAKSILKDAK